MARGKDLNRRSTPSSSPRHIYHKYLATAAQDGPEQDIDDNLSPGWEKLHSSYIPGLEGGLYTVTATQNITSPSSEHLAPVSTQQFYVVAPRYALPSNAVYSVYPPQGHADTPEILPHIVLNDPTLPWERIGSVNAYNDNPADYSVNRVPWLVMLPFTQDELKLPDTALSGDTSIFKNITDLPKDGPTQSSTFTTTINAADLSKLSGAVTPVPYEEQEDLGATTDLVFLPSALFKAFFRTYDPSTGAPLPKQTFPDVSRYRFLSHLRNINVTGMAQAAASTGDNERAFGIVLSHRTGPLAITQPTTIVVHLLSIEGVEQMAFPSNEPYVAMASLYSWTYTCLPPTSDSVYQDFINIGASTSFLRPQIDSSLLSGTLGPQVYQRVQDGFALCKYVTQTGEVTACFNRGPFAPTTPPPQPVDAWNNSLSTVGTDLEILDEQLGIMDVTYATAWHLGRTVALTDAPFTAALTRVRRHIYTLAMEKVHYSLLNPLGKVQTKEDLIRSLPNTVSKLRSRPPLGSHVPLGQRWQRKFPTAPDLSYTSDVVQLTWPEAVAEAAERVSGSMDAEGKYNSAPYDESNTPWSADWAVVLKWALDKLCLASIPSHYLITEPANLPPESLRLFTVDTNWTGTLLDGGLSLGNHIDRDTDIIRVAIKQSILKYLSTANSVSKQKPPIPVYGCYLRSALVTKFPDLRVSVYPDPAAGTPPVLLNHNIVSPDTMLCLFSEKLDINSLTLRFTQPAHQQTFSAATTIDATKITMQYKRIYCVDSSTLTDTQKPIEDPITWLKGADPPLGHLAAFLWDDTDPDTQAVLPNINTLCMPTWVADLFNGENTEMNKLGTNYFTETFPTAALIGLQLNSPCWQLEVSPPPPPPPPPPPSLSMGSSPTLAQNIPETAAGSLGTSADTKNMPTRLAASESRPKGSTRVSGNIVTPNRTQLQTSSHPPPHFRIPKSLPASDTAIPPGVKDDSGSLNPELIYNFWSADSGSIPSYAIPISMQKLPVDIVFSIVKGTGTQPNNAQLQKIEILIPLGDGYGTLTPSYNGPGATMLSNLRFNVLPSYTTLEGNPYLLLKILPRSHTGSVDFTQFQDVSFLLSLVQVNNITNGGEFPTVPVTVTETWNLAQIPRTPSITLTTDPPPSRPYTPPPSAT